MCDIPCSPLVGLYAQFVCLFAHPVPLLPKHCSVAGLGDLECLHLGLQLAVLLHRLSVLSPHPLQVRLLLPQLTLLPRQLHNTNTIQSSKTIRSKGGNCIKLRKNGYLDITHEKCACICKFLYRDEAELRTTCYTQ